MVMSEKSISVVEIHLINNAIIWLSLWFKLCFSSSLRYLEIIITISYCRRDQTASGVPSEEIWWIKRLLKKKRVDENRFQKASFVFEFFLTAP